MQHPEVPPKVWLCPWKKAEVGLGRWMAAPVQLMGPHC